VEGEAVSELLSNGETTVQSHSVQIARSTDSVSAEMVLALKAGDRATAAALAGELRAMRIAAGEIEPPVAPTMQSHSVQIARSAEPPKTPLQGVAPLALPLMSPDRALEEIERREAEPGARIVGGSGTVRANAITRLDNLFQPRGIDPSHVADIAKAIKVRRSIAPLLVLKIGDDAFLLDGHHRHAAFLQVDTTGRRFIACEFWDGSVTDAVLEARARNCDDKLRLATWQKAADAWKLAQMVTAMPGKAGDKVVYRYSKPRLSASCDVAERTIGAMRAVFEMLGAARSQGLTWEQARKEAAGKGIPRDDGAERRRMHVEEKVDRVRRVVGPKFGADDEFAAEVLSRVLGNQTEPVGTVMVEGATGKTVTLTDE
jgi:hypothetical protein